MSGGSSGPQKIGSDAWNIALTERVTRLESEMATMSKQYRGLKRHFDEKVEQVVASNAVAEAEIKGLIATNHAASESKHSETNQKIDKTNELLQTIVNRLSIHQFIFGAFSALGLAAITAFLGGFAKSMFDTVFGGDP